MSESPRMVGGPVGMAICIGGGIALFVAGFVLLSHCNEGLSLILFGAGILAFGLAIYPAGGLVIIGLATLLTVLLVAAGFILGHGMGCGF